MTLLIILLLILLGVILLLIEFVVIPGVTIAGIGGIVLFGYSIYLAFSEYGIWAGVITLLVIVILVPILFYRFFEGKLGKNMQLGSKITGKAINIDRHKVKVGDKGVALTRLTPVGKISVNDEYYEGKSTGHIIDTGTEIEVVKVLNNQIIVKPINIDQS
jgi:membrane-bound ClpP family serine protease